jgi:hypothetical protein
MNEQPNFEKSIEKQKEQSEGQFSGEAENIIKAKKMVTAIRSKFEIMLSKGEITRHKNLDLKCKRLFIKLGPKQVKKILYLKNKDLSLWG